MIHLLHYFKFFLFYVGLVKCQIEPKVVNGEEAEIRNFAYSALISVHCVQNAYKPIAWICGGSVVNQKLILTAAHCIYQCNPNSTCLVSVGSHFKNQGVMIKGERYMTHGDFKRHFISVKCDIALIKLSTALNFNDNVQRIMLTPQPPYKEIAYVAGWGFINEISKVKSNRLYYVEQHVWNKERCSEIVKSVPDGVFCASATDKTQYSAEGDSGSALVVRGYIQIGLVSYKLTNARDVVLYTDTGYYYNWIVNSSWMLLCIKCD